MALALLAPLLAGCALLALGAGVGAGAAGAAYALGDLKAHLPADPPRVAAATERAFQTLGIATVSSSASALDGKVIGRTGADKKVTVGIRSSGENRSKVSIRVGWFGDEAASRAILREMERGL